MNFQRSLATILMLGLAGWLPAFADEPAVPQRRVYVPLTDLDVLFDRDQQGVLLTAEEFQKLSELARAATANRPKAPGVPLAWTTANTTAQALDDQLLLTVRAELEQFQPGWQQVSIPLARTAIEQAKLDGEPALVARGDDGSLLLFIDGLGKHTLELQLSTELAAVGADRVAAFGLLAAPAGKLSLTIPAGKRLQIAGRQLPRPTPLDQPAEYQVAVGGQDNVQLRITDRGTDQAADALVFATTGYGLHVMPGEVSWQALTTLQVFGKPLDKLSLTLPNELEIADVESTGLEAWELADDAEHPGRTKLTLTYRQPFDGERKITFRGVMATPADAPWMVPSLNIANVTSQVGQVVVQTPAGVRLQTVAAEGVRRATGDQAPASDMPIDTTVTAEERWRFDFWQPEFTLRFLTQPRQRELQTAIAAVLDVNSSALDLAVAITLRPRFASLFEVDLELPAEWTLLSVERDGQALAWQTISPEAGRNQWRIPLSPPLAADQLATLQLSIRRNVEGWPVETEPITVDLPELVLPQSNLHEGTLVVRGDDEFQLTAEDVTGLDAVPLKANYERLRYQTQDTRYSGKLRVTRKPSRVAVESLSFTRLDRQTWHAFLQAMVDVQGGGVRTLKIALPTTAGTGLRFLTPRGPRIVEQTSAAGEAGLTIWTLQFDHRIRGTFPLIVDIEQPRGAAETLAVPEWKFLDADRQNGFIAIEASGEQRLTITAKNADGDSLTEVDPLDVPGSFYQPKERIIGVFRTVLPNATVTLAEQRFEKEPVPTAVCRVLSMTSLAAETGAWQQRAEFLLSAIGVQSLSLKLPENSRLWATLVDGKPVEVRRGADVFLIPLPPQVAGISERTLELYYQTDGAALDKLGTVEQVPPALTVVTGTGTVQPVPILEQRWRLYHPRDMLLVGSAGWLEPLGPLDGAGWLARWQERLRRPSWRDLSESLTYAAIAFLLAALPIMVIRRFGGRGLVVTGIMLFCGAIVLVPMLTWTFLAQERSASDYWSDSKQDRMATGSAPTMSGPAATPSGKPTVVTIQQPITEWDETAPAKPRFGSINLDSEGRIQETKENVDHDFTRDINDSQVAGEAMPEAPKSDVPFEPQLPSAGMAGGDKPKSEKPQDEQMTLELDIRQHQEVQQAADDGFPQAPPARTKLAAGRLSLSLDLTPPEGSQAKDFRYIGAGTGSAGEALSLRYAHRPTSGTLRIALMALFALIAWLQRRSSLAWKLSVLILGLGVPLGVAAIAPLAWLVLLDGIFFGTLIAGAVWLADGLCGWCEQNCGWCCSPGVVKVWALVMGVAMGVEGFAQDGAKPQAPAASMERAWAEKSVQTVVVPFAEDADPLAAERVYLPHDQFLKLWRAAHPEKATPAPIDGGLVEALYSATLAAPADQPDRAVVRITARYAIQSHVDGQWSVPLPLKAVALSAAKLDGKSAAVSAKDGGYSVIIPTSGRHVLDLEFSVPAKLAGTAGQFTLPLLPVPAGKLTFQLPSPELRVRINGSTSVYRKVTKDDVASIEVPIDRAGELTVAWQPPQALGNGLATIHVDSATGVAIHDAGVTMTVGLNYRVRQGTIQDVRFLFPKELKLQAVAGDDLGGWELQETPEGRVLRVMFRRAVTDQTQLRVTLFAAQLLTDQAETWELPSFTPQEVTNEIGTVAIYAGEPFAVTVAEVAGLTQIDAARFTPAMPVTSLTTPPRAAYRFARRPVAATLQLSRQTSQGRLLAQHGVSILRRKVQSTSRFHYELTGAPRSAISFALPKDFLTLDVKATALADWFVDQRGDTAVLTVQLAGTRVGTVEAVITGSRPRDPNAAAVEIALPQPLEVTRLESTLALWADDGSLASVQQAEGWRAIDATALGADLQKLRANQPPRFAFQSNQATTAPVTLQLSRGETQLRADSLVTTTVTDFTVVHALALQWQIDGAPVESLSLTTPKALSGRLDFQGSEIREVTEAAAGDDRVRWTIWFRSPVSGKYFATAIAALPPAADSVAAPAVLLERAAAAGAFTALDNQRQYVLLINGSTSQLSLSNPDAVETVQRDDLPIVVPQEQIDQGTELIRLKQLGVAPMWTMQKFVATESIPASVNVADLTTVIARDGTFRTQAIYTIKNRRRQFLALKLPENAVLLSVMLGQQPARCVTATVAGGKAHLIALPKTSEADLSFPVKLVIAGRLPQPLPRGVTWRAMTIEVPAPQVISQTEDEAYGIPVARTKWTVYLADDLDASALRNPAQHNLTVTSSGDGELVYASAAIQELNELLDVYENSANVRQKGRAVDNSKKQLSIVTDNFRSLGRSDAAPQQVAELEEQQRKVIERYNKVQAKIQSNMNAQGNFPNGATVTQNFSDQTDALSFAITNNTSVLSSNGIAIQNSSEATDEMFQLQLQEQAIPQLEVESKSESESAPQFRSKSLSRGAYQDANEGNLDNLNAKISGKKSQQSSHGGFDQPNSPVQFGADWDDIQSRRQKNRESGGVQKDGRFNMPQSNMFGQAGPMVDGPGPGAMGGMGGGMGGIGGGMMGGINNAEDDIARAVPEPTGWTQAGGLSLAMELPLAGQKLVYTKTGGDPKLALSIRPRAALQFGLGLGLAWSLACLVGAVLLASALRGPHARVAVNRVVAWGLLLTGLAGWCLLPEPLAMVALLAMFCGALGVMWSLTAPRQTALS